MTSLSSTPNPTAGATPLVNVSTSAAIKPKDNGNKTEDYFKSFGSFPVQVMYTDAENITCLPGSRATKIKETRPGKMGWKLEMLIDNSGDC